MYEIGDVTASDGNGLDGRADDVSLGDWDNVRDTITGIDNSAGQRAVRDFSGGPGCGEGEDGLDGDVQAGAVEGLKEDLGGIFAVLGWVQGLNAGERSGSVGKRKWSWRIPAPLVGNSDLRALPVGT